MASPRSMRFLPFLAWFPVGAATLRADLVAGATVGLLLIPQGMAYAQLAGLPPIHGLYAGILPCLVGALFGRCPQLSTGPVAMTALLAAGVLAPYAAGGAEAYAGAALALAALVGVLRIVLGMLRFASVVQLFSHPVVAGFTIAAGLVIALSQLHEALGEPAPRSGRLYLDVWRCIAGIGQAHLPTVAMFASCLAAILALRRWAPRLPGTLLVCLAAILASRLGGFAASGGHVVGALPAGLPPLTMPPLQATMLLDLLPGALWVTLIGFMEVVSISRAAAARTRQQVDLDGELIGQGLASVAAAATGGFPVSGSLSRSAVNLDAGARTGLSSVFCAVVVLAGLLWLRPLLEHLPMAALAAALTAAVLPLLRVEPLVRAWRAQRDDGVAGIATLAITLILAPDVVDGMLIGAGIALGLHVRRTMRPRVCVLGRHPDGTMRDAERHGLPTRDDIVTLRFDGRLWFANAGRLVDAAIGELAERPAARWLLIAGDGINELDASAEESLRSLARQLGERGVGLAFYGLKAQVTDVMERSGFTGVVGAANFFRTSEQAIAELERRAGATST